MPKHFYHFGAVGAIGFIVDAGAFTVLPSMWQAPYLARLGAFLIAVATTFVLNKRYTFKMRTKSRPLVYLISQTVSLGVNMAVFSLVIWRPIWLPWQYYAGLAVGSITGMSINYILSRRYAFI